MAYDSATLTALATGQLVLRDFWIAHGWDNLGVARDFSFWTGEDNASVNVVSAIDGTTYSHNYIGGGTLLDVPTIVDAIGLDARTVDFGFSQVRTVVQDMVRAYNIRVAAVEFHRGVLSPSTWALVSTPFPRFLGRVDGVNVATPAAGGTGAITVSCISDLVDLTRRVTTLKSDETQRLRSGDRFRKYADTAGGVEVWWGAAQGSAD